ncbi:MAG TPA: hypothetical protein VM681_06525 [Candidatus Thermoplasmatota archaeon]|nr:hypothetical protein [Candidatus Thermoplasmatota archaeon]
MLPRACWIASVLLLPMALPSLVASTTDGEVPSTGFLAAVAIKTRGSHTLLFASATESIALPASPDGVHAWMLCADDDPDDGLRCTLDVFTLAGEKVASANGSGQPSASIVSVTIPPDRYAGGLLTRFVACACVNQQFPGPRVFLTVVAPVDAAGGFPQRL